MLLHLQVLNLGTARYQFTLESVFAVPAGLQRSGTSGNAKSNPVLEQVELWSASPVEAEAITRVQIIPPPL